MAPDDFWSRKRREEEKEKEEAEERAAEEEARRKKLAASGRSTGTNESGGVSIEELMRRAPTMIDQLEHLYRQYAAGVLARPPVEERARLDQMITQLTHASKTSTTERFKFSNVLQSYSTHKMRWDRLLLDIESGKIKRVAGPKRG